MRTIKTTSAREWIARFIPAHERYVELIGTNGALLFAKPRVAEEYVNDSNEDIANVFRVLREHGPALQRALALTPFSQGEFERAGKPGRPGALERARRWLIRAHVGHCRWPVQCGTLHELAQQWRDVPDSLLGIVERMRGVVVEEEVQSPWELVRKYDSEKTFFFCAAVDSLAGKDQRRLAQDLYTIQGSAIVEANSDEASALFASALFPWRCERQGRYRVWLSPNVPGDPQLAF